MFESESESQRDVKFNFYPFITFFYLRNESKEEERKEKEMIMKSEKKKMNWKVSIDV